MEANLDQVAKELYGKIQTRFPDIKIADEQAQVLSKKEDIPKARFFEFEYEEHGEPLGTIAVSLDADDGIVIKASGDLVDDDTETTHHGAYQFIRSFRKFAREHMLNYEVNNMGKSNLDQRDYEFHAKSGEENMMESKMWGTSKMSYQDLGETRLVVKHAKPVNTDLAAGRTMHIESIYIDNKAGERFRYPVRHLNGARAMAQHIAHGGNPYDEIGQHVVSLSEELSKLRMFKGYVSRTPVVSEAMGAVNDKVIGRIDQIKKEIHQLQRPSYYEEFAEGFAPQESKQIPEEIMNDWVDRLTIRTFNEALKDVFPYIYKIVDESDIPVKELEPDDLLADDEVITDSYIANYRDDTDFKEVADFENYMNGIIGENENEPDAMSGNQDAIAGLKDEVAKGELKGDLNQSSVVGQFIKDQELQDILNKTSGNDDAWPIVKAWLNQKNPEVAAQVFGDEAGQAPAPTPPPTDASAPATPPEAPTADAAQAPTTPPEQTPPEQTPPVAEGGDDLPWHDKTPYDAPKGTFKKSVKPGHEMDRARALAQKFAKKGATPQTKVGEKTLHDMMMEFGLTPEECGMAPQAGQKPMAPPGKPAGDSYDDMKEFASSFYNSQEGNFNVGGTGVKIKLDKQFPGADPREKQRVMHDIERADPSSSLHEAERILRLAGLKGN